MRSLRPEITSERHEMDEKVDHPAHYGADKSGVECIDIVEHMSFNLGNSVKYLWRYENKAEPLVDLRKAEWYIKREIERIGSSRPPHLGGGARGRANFVRWEVFNTPFDRRQEVIALLFLDAWNASTWGLERALAILGKLIEATVNA